MYSRSPEALAYHRWYSTARWQRRRLRQLQAAPLCAMCHARGIVVPATVADHVVQHDGNVESFWYGQLQSLCAPCHNKRKQPAEIKGYNEEIGVDGWPVDMKHPANRTSYKRKA